ncbi:MAG: nucleotidyltransferase substrate binding protein [Spirochaetaceae bacterium]|nr:nucleotidyltransferase substrate binding protein [Spirochaetaceae bacterium]
MNKLDITGLVNAVSSLERSVNVVIRKEQSEETPADELETLHAGVIQAFEFSYELCWKFIKRWIEMNVGNDVVDGVPRRELFRQGAENKLISDVDKWMEFHGARNRTSHTYGENTAAEVYQYSVEFLPYAKALLLCLEKKI